MLRIPIYSLITIVCFLAGCADPLELEVTRKNDDKIRNGVSRLLFSSISLDDRQAISEAQRGLRYAWGYLDKLEVGAEGILAMCREDVLVRYGQYGQQGRRGPIVPAGTTYAQLMRIYDSKLAETILHLLKYDGDTCRLSQAVSENKRVSVRATPPIPAPISEPYGSKPSAIVITNNSDHSIGNGYITWRIYVSGREQPIATGHIPTTFVGGVEAGESTMQSWGVRHFHAVNEIRQAVESFGEDQLLMRACFSEASSLPEVSLVHCLDAEDELAVALVELAITIEELRAIQAEIFNRATDFVAPVTTKT